VIARLIVVVRISISESTVHVEQDLALPLTSQEDYIAYIKGIDPCALVTPKSDIQVYRPLVTDGQACSGGRPASKSAHPILYWRNQLDETQNVELFLRIVWGKILNGSKF
jgi:hypothetical protein